MSNEKKLDAAKSILFWISIVLSVVVCGAYIAIINKSYFFQDDFLFLSAHSELHLSRLLDPASNFGRPVTEDLYWAFVPKFLGSDSSYYFYFNLCIVFGVCALIFKLLREFEVDRLIAASCALIYLYMAPAVPLVSWISNSQHSVAHLLSFAFIVSMVRAIERRHSRLVFPTLIYLLAMLSNVSSLFSIAFVGVYLLLKNRISRVHNFKITLSVLIALTACTLAWSFLISKIASTKYKLDFSLAHMISAARFYTGFLRDGIFGNGYLLLISAILLLTVVNIRRNYLLVLPLVGAFVTAFGMIFFIGQRALVYTAIPYIFFSIILFINFSPRVFRPGEIRSVVLVVLSFSFVFFTVTNGVPTRDFFMDSPYGSGIEDIQAAVRNVSIGKDSTFCFAQANASGFAANAVPAFWTFLQDGKAFEGLHYGDGYARQFLYETDPRCASPDVIRVTIAQRNATLKLVGVTIP